MFSYNNTGLCKVLKCVFHFGSKIFWPVSLSIRVLFLYILWISLGMSGGCGYVRAESVIVDFPQ